MAAYAAAFPDVAIMRLRGLELRNIVPPDVESFFDSLFVMKRDFIEENHEAIEGLGRAIAKATVWGLENPEGVLDITAKYFPEEADDRKFTLALLKETQSLFRLPKAAEGKYGYAVPETVESYMNFLIEQGELKEKIDTDVFINDHVDAYNDFDKEKLE